MPSLEKAVINNTNTGERIQVEFNPEEYTLHKDINYAQTGVPGLSAPILQFVHGNLQTLEMELFLDTYEKHGAGNEAGQDVRALTKKITGLMNIDPATHAPPILLFTWGSLSFTCVLGRGSQRFIMFLADGTPVRARLQVTFNEFRNVDLEAKEIKRETSNYTKLYVAIQGETLSAIANRTYGNPALWRPIAILNGIGNPQELAAGTRLVVPQLPFRDPETGEVYQ
jgi:nucleoid-associated protein YgaU